MLSLWIARQYPGSSPRMRGAPGLSISKPTTMRIIPADAGSTGPYWGFAFGSEDHPRGCGEHWSPQRRSRWRGGSSPRMRGALVDHLQGPAVVRIIPADAGSTCAGPVRTLSHWDHPRGCGEHFASGGRSTAMTGSSPRMRGAPVPAPAHFRHRGIIPADAGSTRMAL